MKGSLQQMDSYRYKGRSLGVPCQACGGPGMDPELESSLAQYPMDAEVPVPALLGSCFSSRNMRPVPDVCQCEV